MIGIHPNVTHSLQFARREQLAATKSPFDLLPPISRVISTPKIRNRIFYVNA